MVNLTVTVDENVLREARIEALRRNTSVNRLVSAYLEGLADRQTQQKNAVTEIRALIREQQAEIDPIGYPRDELYLKP